MVTPAAGPVPEADLAALLRGLRATRRPGTFTFATVPDGADVPDGVEVVASVLEPEGRSVVVREGDARRAGWPVIYRAAWLVLEVHSALDAVGLSAAVSTALAAAGISANVVAGHHHDHVFVPVDRAEEATAVLAEIAAAADPG